VQLLVSWRLHLTGYAAVMVRVVGWMFVRKSLAVRVSDLCGSTFLIPKTFITEMPIIDFGVSDPLLICVGVAFLGQGM